MAGESTFRVRVSVRVFADVSQLAEETSPKLVNVRVRFSPSALCHEMTLDDSSMSRYTKGKKTRKVTTMNYVTINQQFKEEQFSKQFCEKQECSSFDVNCRLVVTSG